MKVDDILKGKARGWEIMKNKELLISIEIYSSLIWYSNCVRYEK